MGLDHPIPHFSWQLQDTRQGAKQTAYQILVSTLTDHGSTASTIWDSGRVASGQSVGVVYRGPALTPSTRYFWRVRVWDQAGQAYPASEKAWWETGLMSQQAWRGQWIGYQSAEEKAVRSAGAKWITAPEDKSESSNQGSEQSISYRSSLTIASLPREAVLFVAAQDTVSVWINGEVVLKSVPLPSWKQLPWKKYTRVDISRKLQTGPNVIAIRSTHYLAGSEEEAERVRPPLSATLVMRAADEHVTTIVTNAEGDWESSRHPAEGWIKGNNDAALWKPAVLYPQATGERAEPAGNPWPAQSVKALRKEFRIDKPIVSARLYVTALGAYQALLNGGRIGDDVLAPGWTDYRIRLKYQTYDVTRQLTRGANALAALLAPGWYSTPLQWFQQPNLYGVAPPSLRAQLRVQYADNSVDWIVSDESWRASISSIVKAEIYDGETEDARLLQPGWEMANFRDKMWDEVNINDKQVPEFALDGEDFEPIRVERILSPKRISEPSPGVYIVDMGQNFSGVERLRVQGHAGARVQVRTGEILNADGTLYTENLRTALSTDQFVLAGKGIEVLEPRFTYHGFRYLELTGLTHRPALADVSGVVFHTDAKFTATLKTGSPMLNTLWSNIVWGQRSNFVGVPTDCPQRDERLGWTADAQVFWRTAAFNMNLAAFSRKYSEDIQGTQLGSGAGTVAAGSLFGIFAPGTTSTSAGSGAGWSDAGIIIPWTAWLQSGDTSVLEQSWDSMTKYLSAIEQSNPDYLWKKNAGTPFGDWLSPEGPTLYPFVATAMWAYDATLMQQMAHALGKKDQEARYAALFARIRQAFQSSFLHQDGSLTSADKGPSPFGVINNPNAKAQGDDTQTGYVLALHMKLVDESLRSAVTRHLVDKIDANGGKLGTGFLGTPYLLSALTENGHADLAYKLLLNTEYPSWGYLVSRGATTMWERWNGDQMKSDPSMNSYNHYAYGAVAEWIYRYAAGIDTTASDPGFHTIYLHPLFSKQLGSLDFTYDSMYGTIRSTWEVRQRSATWHLTIPPNASGWLPVSSEEATRYRIDSKPIASDKRLLPITVGGVDGYLLAAGSYRFEVGGID